MRIAFLDRYPSCRAFEMSFGNLSDAYLTRIAFDREQGSLSLWVSFTSLPSETELFFLEHELKKR